MADTEHHIKAVIYDMDGVIVDSEPLWREVEIRVFGGIGIQLTDAMCRETMGLRVDEVISHWFHRFPGHSEDIAEIGERIYDGMIATLKEKATPMAGVVESMDFFASKGIPLALASTSPMRLIDAVIDAFTLRSRFSALHSAEFETHGKPHPGVYLTTATALGVPSHACLAIEDSVNGVVAAKAARMKVIAVPEPDLASDSRYGIANVVISSLLDVDDALWKRIAS